MAGLIQVNNSGTSGTINLDSASKSMHNVNELWQQHLQAQRQFRADDRVAQLQGRDDKTYADAQRDAEFAKNYANGLIKLPNGTAAPASSTQSVMQTGTPSVTEDQIQMIKQAIPGSGQAAVYQNQQVPARPVVENPQIKFNALIKGGEIPNPMYTGELKPETSARMARIKGIETKYAPLLQNVNAGKNPESNIPGRTNPVSQVLTPAKQALLDQMEAEKSTVYATYSKTINRGADRVEARTVGLGGVDMSRTFDSTGTKAAPVGDGSQAYFRTKTKGANGHYSMVPALAAGTAQAQATPEMINKRMKIQDAIPVAYQSVMSTIPNPNKPITTVKDTQGNIINTVSAAQAGESMANSFSAIAANPTHGKTMEQQKKDAIKDWTAEFIKANPGADASKLLPLADKIYDASHNTGKLSDSETASMNAQVKDLEHRYSIDKDTTAYNRDLAKIKIQASNSLALQDRADTRADKRQASSDAKEARQSKNELDKEELKTVASSQKNLVDERKQLVRDLKTRKSYLISREELSKAGEDELKEINAELKQAISGMPK